MMERLLFRLLGLSIVLVGVTANASRVPPSSGAVWHPEPQSKFSVNQKKESVTFQHLTAIRAGESSGGEGDEDNYVPDLAKMHWGPVAVGDILKPWDLVWAQGGILEITVEEYGAERLSDEGTTLKDAVGRYTDRWLIPASAILVLHPRYFRRVRVEAVYGQVWVSLEAREAEAFFERHQILIDTPARLGY
jgi:hypothetical protein